VIQAAPILQDRCRLNHARKRYKYNARLHAGRFSGLLNAIPAIPVNKADHPPATHFPAKRPAPDTFEALLTAARQSPNRYDFALIAMLGLLGLRIFETTGADIADLGEEHGHRVLRVCGKGTKIVLVPLPPAVARAIDRATGSRTRGPVLLNRRGTRMDRHAATRRLHNLAVAAGIQIAARHADPRTTTRYDRARNNLDRHPNYILAACMASGT